MILNWGAQGGFILVRIDVKGKLNKWVTVNSVTPLTVSVKENCTNKMFFFGCAVAYSAAKNIKAETISECHLFVSTCCVTAVPWLRCGRSVDTWVLSCVCAPPLSAPRHWPVEGVELWCPCESVLAWTAMMEWTAHYRYHGGRPQSHCRPVHWDLPILWTCQPNDYDRKWIFILLWIPDC